MNIPNTFFKSVLRIVVDSCILPGTVSGTEVLLLYVSVWKNEVSAFCPEALCSFFFQPDLVDDGGGMMHQPVGSEQKQ